MAPLSPESRALLQAGRHALSATPADRARVEAALRAQLGAAALPPNAPAPALGPSTGWSWLGKAAATCVVGSALYFALAPRVKPPAAQNPATQPGPSAALDAPSAGARAASEAPAATVQVPPSAGAPEAPPAALAPPRQHDRLAQEVALLSRATSALKAGAAADALKLLDAHQRRFPAGVLSEERRAAKAQALCLLGRSDEGRAELGQLAPSSPASNRAKQLCDRVPAQAQER